MITLTAPQEAALNAAGEAMLDIKNADGPRFHLAIAYMSDDFQAFTNDSADTVWGRGKTAALAVADLLDKFEAAKDAPPKLKTAKEAIAAVKQMVSDGPLGDSDDIIAKLDALPVA